MHRFIVVLEKILFTYTVVVILTSKVGKWMTPSLRKTKRNTNVIPFVVMASLYLLIQEAYNKLSKSHK